MTRGVRCDICQTLFRCNPDETTLLWGKTARAPADASNAMFFHKACLCLDRYSGIEYWFSFSGGGAYFIRQDMLDDLDHVLQDFDGTYYEGKAIERYREFCRGKSRTGLEVYRALARLGVEAYNVPATAL